jgi:hypothetical protein
MSNNESLKYAKRFSTSTAATMTNGLGLRAHDAVTNVVTTTVDLHIHATIVTKFAAWAADLGMTIEVAGLT